MNPLIQLKKATPVFFVALVCFGLLPTMHAVSPPPDGGYPGGNTAEGDNALLSLTTGGFNTAVGWFSLSSNTTGSWNTATGVGALLFNTAYQNTATGAGALLHNTTGFDNTASGALALYSNTTGSYNTANGYLALSNNTTGSYNTANGFLALSDITAGSYNTAIGSQALSFNTTASLNTAVGDYALYGCTGGANTALGNNAGGNIIDGTSNVAVGSSAGTGIVHASNVIAIGAFGVSSVFGDASETCYIGYIYGQPIGGAGIPHAVWVDRDGVLGFNPSSRRFKHDIKPMDKASEVILALKPVTFKYNSDNKDTPEYGLIAEDVAEVNPDLIFRDNKGQIASVRYEQIDAMLLNEFLKEHRRVEQLEKQVEALTAGLQKISAQVEMNRTAPQMVASDQ